MAFLYPINILILKMLQFGELFQESVKIINIGIEKIIRFFISKLKEIKIIFYWIQKITL